MTPFIFEDGNTYYFKIVRREHSNDYHDLYVYEKVTQKHKSFWGKITETSSYNKLNESPQLVSVRLNTDEIKGKIKITLIATKATHQLKDWDGFVGNVPDDYKKAILRDGKLKNILGE